MIERFCDCHHPDCTACKICDAYEKERDELAAQFEVMRAALGNVLPWVVTQVVACHGLKCREPVCESCSLEAEIAAQDARLAHAKANEAISILPSTALREIEARVLEEAAEFVELFSEEMSCKRAAEKLRERAAAKRKGAE